MLKHPSVKHTVGKGARVLVKEERQVKKRTDIFQKIFGQKVMSSRRRQLSWSEFYSLALYLQLSLNYIIIYFDMVLIHGALFSVFVNLFISMVMGLPMTIINIMLGNYSRKSYLRMWQMVPMFSGIGWSVAFYQLWMECFNISAAGMALLYITDTFKANNWRTCDFPGATENCIPVDTREEFVENCCTLLSEDKKITNCKKTSAQFASLEYFRNSKLGMNSSEEDVWKTINWDWVLVVGVVWICIYMFMVQDFPRFKKVVMYVAVICLTMASIPMLIIVCTAKQFSVPESMASRMSHLLNLKSFVGLIDVVISNSLPGSIVFFGANISSDKSPPVIAAVLCGVKIVLMTLLLNWMSMSINMVKATYKVNNANCFHIFGYDFMFAVVPDALSQLLFSRIWVFLWFTMIFIWGTFTGLFTGTAFIDTLIERFPKLMRFRLCTCTMFCTCGFLVNCVLLNKNYLLIYYHWIFNGMHIIALALGILYLIALYIYTMPKLTTDYLFHYGVPLANVWIVCLKYTSLVIVGCVCLISVMESPKQVKFNGGENSKYYEIASLSIALCYLIPIPVFIVYYYIKFSRISQLSKYFIHSLPLWGPPTNEEKQARRCFNPQRQLRYKVVIRKCKHNCLLNSSKLQDEIERLNENTRILFEALEKHAQEDEGEGDDFDLDL